MIICNRFHEFYSRNLNPILILIGFVVIPCLTAETDTASSGSSGSNKPAQAESSVSPISRWIELHKQIYLKSSEQIDLKNLETILTEMALIERGELFKLGIKPFKEVLGFRIRHFRNLIKRSNELNFVINPDATITDVLLQTLDHNSNDCTAKYFDYLTEINKELQNTSMASALHKNRHLQYKNCLDRSMELLVAATKLIGSRVKELLKNMLEFLYSNQSDQLIKFSSFKSIDFGMKSMQLAEKMASYLNQQQINSNQSDEIKLKSFILYPCTEFIAETKDVIGKILQIIGLDEMAQYPFSKKQASILNQYLLCDRILADREFICSSVKQFTSKNYQVNAEISRTSGLFPAKIDAPSKSKDFEPASLEPEIDTGRENISTELRLGYDVGNTLITQHNPIEQIELSSNSDKSDQQGIGVNDRHVVRIVPGFRRGRLQVYRTHWSDGKVTLETKENLEKKCPDKLESLRQKFYTNMSNPQMAQRSKLLNQPQNADQIESALQTSDIAGGHKIVIKIDKPVGAGIGARFPTHWSDGTVSRQTRSYLQQYWPRQLNNLLERMAVEEYAKHLDKYNTRRALAEQQIGIRKRPRLIKPALPEEQSSTNKMTKNQMRLISRVVGNSKKPKVISIELEKNINPAARLVSKYQTTWSDGTKTLENKEYLSYFWPDAWNKFQFVSQQQAKIDDASKFESTKKHRDHGKSGLRSIQLQKIAPRKSNDSSEKTIDGQLMHLASLQQGISSSKSLVNEANSDKLEQIKSVEEQPNSSKQSDNLITRMNVEELGDFLENPREQSQQNQSDSSPRFIGDTSEAK